MQYLYKIASILTIGLILASCSGEDKMTQLEKLKAERDEIESKISELEKELIASGEITKTVNKVLVTTYKVQPQNFAHKVEIRGGVESLKDVMLAAETMGRIESIPVMEGEKVGAGQILVKQDASVLQNNVAEVKTQLELATTVYERQKRLWDQNIGTEVQYLQAKNNKESLERRLSTLYSQLGQATVRAPFSGVVDDLPVRLGQMAQPGMPLVRIVNPDQMYISADVSESLLGKLKEDQSVEIYFPSQDKRLTSTVSSVGQAIKSENRTFEIQVKLPKAGFPIKPNQVVVLKLVDYSNATSIAVPTKIIQRDNKGSYVYEIKNTKEGKIADKVYVETGMSYEQKTEIKSGLSNGQVLAYEGYRELTPGLSVEVQQQ